MQTNPYLTGLKLVNNPYLAGLELVKYHEGTGGQIALAKCILSLYNSEHSFSIGGILASVDGHYAKIILAMITEYLTHGETKELREAGSYVYENFPRLVELSDAMSSARYEVRKEWDRQREEEAERLYPNG